ncbi:SUMF1/EgtB/PvdO family nonheme iron enzyme [Methylomonas sp. EFPC3]|uniref:SUMF1/EgtB/PvdO family nonheme iron enzyme n=1 Tax=Methylomonas sp. EFPC3 TaxID=3021710 RepID=UPI00241725CF|nr:SUMF1/EgtB/PvdO family nonheme iron enzyme [Methylomonas sp. EFPC3]WFP51965.1 SUMF1/EgtB/PvdO family nonheme iron enzyme [Methylomonas sp. EFPC3]
MSENDTLTKNGFYQAGGTLKADVPSYIERRADQELYDSLLASEFCYVLTPRQMGKSSLMTHTAARLRKEGHHVAVVDLSGVGGDANSITADQWYYSLCHRLNKELKLNFSLSDWWQQQTLLSPLQRLMNFFEEGILSSLAGRVFLFFDEIDTTINLLFSDDFFAAIRACFNARANDGRFNNLTFVLLGVASPADLIRDQSRTPFNIGKRIDLTDFRDDEASLFLEGLPGEASQKQATLQRILCWTGGHPFLTQHLCLLAGKTTSPHMSVNDFIDQLVAAEFFGIARRTKQEHLKVINERIAQASRRAAILKVYAKVLKGKPIQDQPQSPIHAALKLSGLVKTDDSGRLAIRNRIYQKVFDARWIKSLQPPRWIQRGTLASALIAAIVFGWWIGSQQLSARVGTAIVLAFLGIAYPEPEMREIPAGHFLIGSPEDEPDRSSNEGPRHEVNIRRFALGKFEVTFDEYDVFAFLIDFDGGCRDGHQVERAKDEGWGRGKRPVINVSWRNAQCFAEWLSKNTGKHYRLPSEAEWEYAARAGSQTARPWPGRDDASCLNANVFDRRHEREIKDFLLAQLKSPGMDEKQLASVRELIESWKPFTCDDDFPFTAPVGSFLANAFALNDMLGNVLEWTQDCWHGDYEDAPVDGSVWSEANSDDCSQRVIRGGSWFDGPAYLRAAFRGGFYPGGRDDILGFRLAQDP